MLNKTSLKRARTEIDNDKQNFNMNSVVDVKSRLNKKKQKLLNMTRELMGLKMQIRCLEGQLKSLCKHEWVKSKEETGVYNRPPIKCMHCGIVESVAQA